MAESLGGSLWRILMVDPYGRSLWQILMADPHGGFRSGCSHTPAADMACTASSLESHWPHVYPPLALDVS